MDNVKDILKVGNGKIRKKNLYCTLGIVINFLVGVNLGCVLGNREDANVWIEINSFL